MSTVPEKFPVWQTAMDALDYCWEHRALAVRFGGIPLVIGMGASWALLAFGIEPSEPSAALFAIAAVQVLIFLAPTVTWYRLVAYGEQEAANRPLFTLGRLEIRLLLWQIIFAIGWILPFGLLAAVIGGLSKLAESAGGQSAALIVAVPLGAAWLVAFIVAGTRLAMILALASLDEQTGFRAAWRITQGIAWRLTAATVLVILAIVLFIAIAELAAWLLGMILAIAVGAASSDVLPYLRVPAEAVINLGGLYAIATLFGFIYRARADMLRPAPEAPSIPVL